MAFYTTGPTSETVSTTLLDFSANGCHQSIASIQTESLTLNFTSIQPHVQELILKELQEEKSGEDSRYASNTRYKHLPNETCIERMLKAATLIYGTNLPVEPIVAAR